MALLKTLGPFRYGFRCFLMYSPLNKEKIKFLTEIFDHTQDNLTMNTV